MDRSTTTPQSPTMSTSTPLSLSSPTSPTFPASPRLTSSKHLHIISETSPHHTPGHQPKMEDSHPIHPTFSRQSTSIPHMHNSHPLSTIFSGISLSEIQSRSQHVPPRNDGFTNEPPPLPHDPALLERMLTNDPDIERQMAVGIEEGDVGPPPEGGREAWAVVFSAFWVLFCAFGFITSFGQLEIYYLSHQLSGYSKSTVAWIASIQTFICFAGSFLSGRYFDSHGARPVIVTGTTLTVIALVATAFCKEYYQFFLAHVCFGVGGAMIYSPATAVVGHWFMRKRSTAVGIVVCGSGLGGVIYPIALKQLLDKLSFRDTMLIIAGMNAVLMLPSWWLLKARLPPRTPPPFKDLKRPWKDAKYTCLVLGTLLVGTNWATPYFNAPTLASANSLSPTLSAYAVALLQTGSFFGRALSGLLADKFGVWNMFISSSVSSAIVLFAFWIGSPLPPAAVVVGLVGYGFTSGAWITLVAASTGAISPTREFGMRLGMVWSVTGIGLLAGPVISGALVGAANGLFVYAGIFCALTTLLGAGLTIAPRALEMYRVWRSGGGDDESQEKESVASPSSLA